MEDRLLKPESARRSWWRLPLLLFLVLAAILWWQANRLHEAPQAKSGNLPTRIGKNDPRPKTFFTIDYGNGNRTSFAAIEWHEGMTVADLMTAWPTVAVRQKGSGESAFVTAINNVENQGADGKNWIYSVNGQVADRSFAVYKLKAEDHVLWTFGPRQ